MKFIIALPVVTAIVVYLSRGVSPLQIGINGVAVLGICVIVAVGYMVIKAGK